MQFSNTVKSALKNNGFISQIIGFIYNLLPHKRHDALKKYIRKYLPKNPVIVEAGAHIGIDLIEMSKIWPKGQIHAFEPVPDLFLKLTQNVKKYSNIHCYPFALGEKCGNAEMFVSSGKSDASSSLLQPLEHLNVHPDVAFDSKVLVEEVTLDEWAVKNNIAKVDFLWLDLQGYELIVLKSAPKILKNVKVIYTEVNLKEVYKNVALYPEVRQWLEKNEFVVDLEDLPWDDSGDVLFVRKN